MTKLAERLRALRKEQHATQIQTAEAMGLSHISYCRYEKGEREPAASTLVQMADFYHVSLDYLVGRSEQREVIS